MSSNNRRNTRHNRRRHRTNDSEIFDAETLLIHEYIGLMRSMISLNTERSFSVQNNINNILRNLNTLFDNYYRWGRAQQQNNNQNNTPTNNNNRNRNAINTNRNTEVVYNWGFPNTTSRNDSQSPITAPTRTWSDIVSGNTRPRHDRHRDNDRPITGRNVRSRPRSDRTLWDFNFTTNRESNTNRVIRPPTTNNTFQTFLNNTLHTANFRGYTLSREQINQQITTIPWREIRETTDQTVCPINQTEFTDDEMISRINYCGHIFSANAINNYLLNYDNRCPVCRVNLSRNISQNNTTSNTLNRTEENRNTINNYTTNTITENTTQTNSSPLNSSPPNPALSNTTQTTPSPPNPAPPNTGELSNTLTQEINNAVNIMSNAVVNEITNSLINTPTRPEQITAEYSLFLPNTTDTSRLTQATQPRTFSWTPDNGFTFQSENTNNTSINNTQTPESDASRYVTTYVESAFSTNNESNTTILENNNVEEKNEDEETREEKREESSSSNRK